MKTMKEGITDFFDGTLKTFSARIGKSFNNQAPPVRIAIACGVGIAVVIACMVIMVSAFTASDDAKLSHNSIVQPTLTPMEHDTQNEFLIPLGKMKGEIDGEFEAFYLGIDTAGIIYMNRHPPFEDTFKKSAAWEIINKEKLKEYEKLLHFLPIRKKGIRR